MRFADLILLMLFVGSLTASAAAATSGSGAGPALRATPNHAFEPKHFTQLFKAARRLTERDEDMDIELPSLVSVSPEQFGQRVCPDNPAACQRWAATYGVERREIVYRDNLAANRSLDRSYLVHEMVHYLQHREQGNAFNGSCQAILNNEREAYAAQNRYLLKLGFSLPTGMMSGLRFCPPEETMLSDPPEKPE